MGRAPESGRTEALGRELTSGRIITPREREIQCPIGGPERRKDDTAGKFSDAGVMFGKSGVE
jgi:hypothetical protein